METILIIIATLWFIGWAEIITDPNEPNPFERMIYDMTYDMTYEEPTLDNSN